jgi:hypothetical protein
METQDSPVRRYVLTAAVAVLALTLVPVSLAGKGGNGNGGGGTSATIALVMVDPATGLTSAALTSGPHWGDTVKFEGTTTSTPNVELVCSQNGTVVYAGLSGWYETTFADGAFSTRNLKLASQAWSGGAATCTARLYHISGLKTVTDATMQLSVAA